MKTSDQIKALITSKGFNPSQISMQLGWNRNTLNTKLRRGTLKIDELKAILKIIRYKMDFVNEDTD